MHDKARELLRRAHDLMDDQNAKKSYAGCDWCNSRGYDENGLNHNQGCVLVEMRMTLEYLEKVPQEGSID